MKKQIITTFLLFISLTVFGQWFVETNLGYSLAMRKNYFMYDNSIRIDDMVNDTSIGAKYPNKFTIIQSPIFNVSGGYKFNSNWAISLGVSYFDNKNFKNFNNQNSFFRHRIIFWSVTVNNDRLVAREFIDTYSYYTQGFYLLPEVSYTFCLWRFRFSPFVGVPLRYLTVYEIATKATAIYVIGEDPPEFVTQRYYYKYPFLYTLNNMLGLSSGLQISYDIGGNLELSSKINCMLNPGNEFLERVQTLYEKENDGKIVESDNNEYVRELRKVWFTKSFNFTIGIRYYFNK
ncbi:MAG TPA: hypothetical protein PLW77_11100 [Bacteroidales bacterium]|nr:hypothetical protein [Bacteroidales bacterium]HQB20935.1 hypothetical protein [Bacteroidales bacterium]